MTSTAIRIMAVISGTVLGSPGADDPAPDSRPPNVVIFLTDDQGTLDAGCYGSGDLYTPNVDALAAAGVRFTQAYSHTVCCPARALLLTGRHPQRSGVNRWMRALPNSQTTIVPSESTARS